MKKTKKMPVSVSYGDFKAKSNEFLVPCIKDGSEVVWAGMKSGHVFTYGAISYIGKEISADDIYQRMPKSLIDRQDKGKIFSLLESYLDKLQLFKIGNVITLECLPNGGYNLVKVAEKVERKMKRNLP